MKLESVQIERYRSIESVRLSPCSSFNVLIGENNSGKSNILSGIDFFFQCISDGQVLKLAPPIGKPIDFFNRVAAVPIQITLSFQLNDEDRKSLTESISEELPQVQNTVGQIDRNLPLAVTLRISPLPNHYAYIKNISLQRLGDPTAKSVVLLDVGEAAANELYQAKSAAKREKDRASDLEKFIRRFDSDDWERLRKLLNESPDFSSRNRGDFFLRRYLEGSTPEIMRFVTKTFTESESYEEFRQNLRADPGSFDSR